MRKSITKALIVLGALSAFSAMPAVSMASQGADDPPGHNVNDDGPGHR